MIKDNKSLYIEYCDIKNKLCDIKYEEEEQKILNYENNRKNLSVAINLMFGFILVISSVSSILLFFQEAMPETLKVLLIATSAATALSLFITFFFFLFFLFFNIYLKFKINENTFAVNKERSLFYEKINEIEILLSNKEVLYNLFVQMLDEKGDSFNSDWENYTDEHYDFLCFYDLCTKEFNLSCDDYSIDELKEKMICYKFNNYNFKNEQSLEIINE